MLSDTNGVLVTVFSKPACPQCDFTKKHLEKLHIPARIIDVSDSPDAAEFLRREGFASLPVVFPADRSVEPWAGFRPSLIEELVVGAVAA
jgi:glutaredoxin-like protein NrdH